MSDERRILSPVAATLFKAADYIEAHGWCQVNFEQPDGRVCALGALRIVARTGEEHRGARYALFAHLREESVINWNDDKRRTQAEVVAALRESAREALTAGK